MDTNRVTPNLINWLVLAAMVTFAIVIAVTFGEPLDIARVSSG